ncbi:MAG: glycerol-3-phosphate dehydrogenase [NAD(P)+] [Gemmatales bacterium]|nr:MAG: glycerol-3-phosphate dehydrogenase [NAD(P)+] [Gemmatales bacterium]
MKTMKRFAILGDGAWGTAVALLLAAKPQHRVALWSAREENGRLLQQRRENVHLLPGVPIPKHIKLTTDIEDAVCDADLWVVAIPTIYLRPTLKRVAPALQDPVPVLSLVKGLEAETFQRPSEIINQVIGKRSIAVLSGPSHAEEVSRGLPTTVVVASADAELCEAVQHAIRSDRFRVYTNLDVIGVELAGALKNIVGIAAGICDGLGFGDNSKAALLTRGLVEMARFGTALGAEYETFFGLAGLGDLITTCQSRHGRNRYVGEKLAQGMKLPEILASTKMIAEGVNTTRSVYERARKMGVSMPITTEVYRILYEGKDPLQAVQELMAREPRSEM